MPIIKVIKDNPDKLSLMILRYAIAADFGINAAMKFIDPQLSFRHINYVYGIEKLSVKELYTVAGFQSAIAFLLFVGFQKKLSYGMTAVCHIAFVIAMWGQIQSSIYSFDPTGLNYLIACIATICLYMLRDEDNWLTLDED